MTTLESDASTGTPAASSSRRGPIALLGLVISIVVVVTSWWAWTVYVAGGIEVGWAGEPSCTGTSLGQDGHAILTSEAMSCVITVTVRNTGPVAVTLDRAVLPYMGPGGGSVVKAVAMDERVPTGGSPADFDIDAHVELDHEIASGESWTFRLRIRFRSDGCTAPGEMSIDDWPIVTTTYLGRDIDVAAGERLAFVTHRQNPGCSLFSPGVSCRC